VKYAWIEEHKMNFQTTMMCKVLKVDRSSYYHWVKMGSNIEKIDEPLNRYLKRDVRNTEHDQFKQNYLIAMELLFQDQSLER
jgi:hypothetical protein